MKAPSANTPVYSVDELQTFGVKLVKRQKGGTVAVFHVGGRSVTVPFFKPDVVAVRALKDAARRNRASLPETIVT